MTSLVPFFVMALPRLPQEIADYIVDLLHDEPETLKRCCLVSKSWISRVRRHLFYEIRIDSRADLAAWKRVFPDPANSPGYYTRSLRITSVDVTAADFEEGGWFRAFSNVVRLKACDCTGNLSSLPFDYFSNLSAQIPGPFGYRFSPSSAPYLSLKTYTSEARERRIMMTAPSSDLQPYPY